jgi:hypothetical protein
MLFVDGRVIVQGECHHYGDIWTGIPISPQNSPNQPKLSGNYLQIIPFMNTIFHDPFYCYL